MAPAPAPQADCDQGWTFGLEALYLKAYQSEGSYEDTEYDFGGRVSLGYQFSDCLFTKVTYFGYKTDVFENSNGNGFSENDELEVSYLDWVVGQHFMPSDKLTLSPYVGLRWGTFEETYTEKDFDYYESESYEFSGLGIVVGVDATRALGSGFSLYGTAKQSILFGTTDYSYYENDDGSIDRDSDSTDNVVFVSELGLGLQYDHSFASFDANIRLGVEGQWWGGASNDDSESAGLGGFVLGANFRF